MASPRHHTRSAPPVILRAASPEFQELRRLVFRRHPEREWASFAWFGWRETPTALVVTLAALEPPRPGDVDETYDHVRIHASYSTRMALAAERHRLAVGLVHSHPSGWAPHPSDIDDDMDAYYADYFAGFAPDRPYVSLILSEIDGVTALSGRVCWRGRWQAVRHGAIERDPAVEVWPDGDRPAPAPIPPERVARFTSAFGKEAHQRLRRSTVAVIGAGGTGSAAIPILARAGVGRIIVADSDRVSESNLERMHGSRPEHAANAVPKALLAYEHVHAIDPTVTVEAYIGRLPQKEIVDAVATADVVLGCTDQQHSRWALSDVSTRYLVPAIDSGGLIESRGGVVTGQIAQLVRFLSMDPCVRCRGMVDPARVEIELLSEEERARRNAAAGVGPSGRPGPADIPPIDTVGYITTVMGTMAAGYAIGWLTGRFDAPFERMQMNFVAECLDVTDRKQKRRPDCACGRLRGWADQGADEAPITAPDHWPPVQRVTLPESRHS
jgi:molybdopterin/thiamine biosynthesis adenylyltransferase